MTIIDLNFLGNEHAIASFLLETTEGPILVETGPHSTFEHLNNGIQAAGYAVEDVRHVFLTHIHLDHAGAAWAFAEQGARVYVHPLGVPHLEQPERLMSSARRIYQDQMDTLWGAMKPIAREQLQAVEDRAEISVGDLTLKALHTPGHAVHHIAWEVDKTIFCGDVAGVKIDQGPVVPPCPPPDINVEDWQASIRLILERKPDQLFLTHYGEVKEVKTHLIKLEEALLDWAQWIRPHYDAGRKTSEIAPEFMEYVKGQLEAGGVFSKEAQLQYEAANPSWMSVAGLIRYWRKKLEKQG